MTTKTISPMQTLYTKLHHLGFKKSTIKKLLPEWWHDDIAKTPAGLQEASLILSKYLSIRYSSLIGDVDPSFNLPNHKFKHAKNVQEHDLNKAVALSSLSGRLTLEAYDSSLAQLENLSAQSIRETLLNRNCPWIDFNILLDYCWEIGVPVIFLENLPSPKMQGLALKLYDRPVIILTSKHKYGYLVFHLAHELGHIILGHVTNDNWVIDEKISEHNDEDIEQAANQFALELLTGNSDAAYRSERNLYPSTLAVSALSVGRDHKVDPLHIVLNYGHTNQCMPIANSACQALVRKLSISESDQEIAKSTFMQYVDVDRLDDEKALRHLIGM
ncbi:ImmA/IrrE family metallo-endopeptidase [Acinetobacter sp. ANC 5378]|uniref:ImmA/IrrE family metallo-endopeptidase n=1 Tax=Acinetobacter sp. ANC 5378 TaxID=2731249 RepID=UPI0014906779|nr:ImmA/IrrE family metallo-endopeptidase [Acinetobacter sp. ANC 5378]NNG83214.1 ImmA/IrrE family metallo-endopeptidase [Acinetobacter sp. ANC 5378]